MKIQFRIASFCVLALLTIASASDFYGRITLVFPYSGTGETDQFEFQITNTVVNQYFQASYLSYGTEAIRFVVSKTLVSEDTYKSIQAVVLMAYSGGENVYVGTFQAGTVNPNVAVQTGLTLVGANGGNAPGQDVFGVSMYK
jgi:hypothetical protein